MIKVKVMAARKDERLLVSPLGEFYEDLIKIDAWINARTIAGQANSLLCGKLQEREQRIRDRVEYLASKRGIKADELWKQILKGEARKIEPDEISETED
jgi:hypothetical protein